MPCKCSGLRVNACKCRVLRTRCCSDKSGSVVLLTPSNSLCRLLDIKDARPNFILSIIENAYEICAGYNLRYCPIRGFFRHENYIRIAIKDLIILVCFLVANFVVFITILTKMMVHMYFVLRMAAHWFQRSFISKLDVNKEVMTMSPSQLFHDYSSPLTHKFL